MIWYLLIRSIAGVFGGMRVQGMWHGRPARSQLRAGRSCHVSRFIMNLTTNMFTSLTQTTPKERANESRCFLLLLILL